MVPEKLLQVLKHEGVIAIASQGTNEPHLVNTWNSYIKVTEDERILVPVGGMKTTESNINRNNKVILTAGSREVEGFHGMGTGFLINGTATFIKNGAVFDEIKQKFPWTRAAMEIKITTATQTL